MRRLCILVIAFVPFLGAQAQDRPGGVLGRGRKTPEGVSVQRDLVYRTVDETEIKLDLYRPKAAAAAGPGEGADKPAGDAKEKPAAALKALPAVVFIHGGGWRGGDKGDAGALCGWLAQQGFVAASINYRLSGDARYPAQIEDVQEAVRWLRAHAKEYGIDPGHIGAMGKSAGAHLAALLGAKDGKDCRVQAVVSFFGPHDLNTGAGGNQSAPLQLIGAGPDEKPEAWKDASCSTHLTPDDPPVLMIHGDQDETVPLSQSRNYLKNLKAQKIEADLVVVKGGGHGLNGRGLSPSPEEIDDRVLEFLRKHLMGKEDAPGKTAPVGAEKNPPGPGKDKPETD